MFHKVVWQHMQGVVESLTPYVPCPTATMLTPCAVPQALVQQWCTGVQRMYLLLLQ